MPSLIMIMMMMMQAIDNNHYHLIIILNHIHLSPSLLYFSSYMTYKDLAYSN